MTIKDHKVNYSNFTWLGIHPTKKQMMILSFSNISFESHNIMLSYVINTTESSCLRLFVYGIFNKNGGCQLIVFQTYHSH